MNAYSGSQAGQTFKTKYHLFTEVRPFYEDLVKMLTSAEHTISMMYFTFDCGVWTEKFCQVLRAKVLEGVKVRLMVDQLGLIVDNPRHAIANKKLMENLRDSGIQVDLFHPFGHRLSKMNRLHLKVCAIDTRVTFLGGSNLGDYYLGWDDSNLRIVGNLGMTFHQVYDYLLQFVNDENNVSQSHLQFSNLRAGDVQLWLTIPKQRRDIRRALLDMILDADKPTKIFFRNWYFLPDREILDAMRSQANLGVVINVLLSHRTRVWLIDFANYIHGHKLAKAGGKVFRFTKGYMHAKVSWNDNGKVLFGSANMDAKALESNFELCVTFSDEEFAKQLQKSFYVDVKKSFLQTPDVFLNRSFPKKILSYACNLASPWL